MSFDSLHARLRHPPFDGSACDAASAPDGQLSRWPGGAHVTSVRSALACAGIELTGPHTGRIAIGPHVADLHVEPDDLILLRCIAPTDEPRILLERSTAAAGNIRFATLPQRGSLVLGDTRVNGVGHLPDSLRGIVNGLADALDGRAPAEPTSATPLDAALRDALDEAAWSKEDAVETPGGFELYTTLEGNREPVQATVDVACLRVHRTIIDPFPEGNAGRAAAHQAVACNARLRGCRLALAEGRLCVESQLQAAQVTGEWLSFAVRAVANAARAVSPELELLAREPAVADAYVDMFLTPTQKS